MTHEELHNVLRKRFSDLIAVPELIPTAWDNVELSEADRSGKSWVRFTILTGESNQASAGAPGANLHRTVGIAVAQIFVPVGGGDAPALKLADKIKAAFKAQTLPSLTLRTPSVETIGLTGVEWQVNVNCPFISDHVS